MLKAPRKQRQINRPTADATKREIRTYRYQQMRARAKIDQGAMCQDCWTRDKRVVTDNLEAHHIKPRRTHPHLTSDPTNLMFLCPTCHEERDKEAA